MSPIEVRPATLADMESLSEVLVEVHGLDGYPVEGVSSAQQWLWLPQAIQQWVATRSGEPIGHIALMPPMDGDIAPRLLAQKHVPEANLAVVSRLFVAPSARKRSVADYLMEVAEAHARENDLHLVLDVLCKDESAIRLYRRRGWAPIGSGEHDAGGGQVFDALAMAGEWYGNDI